MQAGCQGTWGNQAFPDLSPGKLIHTPGLGVPKWASSYAAGALIGLLTQASGGLRLWGGVFFMGPVVLALVSPRCEMSILHTGC